MTSFRLRFRLVGRECCLRFSEQLRPASGAMVIQVRRENGHRPDKLLMLSGPDLSLPRACSKAARHSPPERFFSDDLLIFVDKHGVPLKQVSGASPARARSRCHCALPERPRHRGDRMGTSEQSPPEGFLTDDEIFMSSLPREISGRRPMVRFGPPAPTPNWGLSALNFPRLAFGC
jgi:hypothetical protein